MMADWPHLPHVTHHAIERACERLGAADEAEALALLSGPAFAAALTMRARSVRFGGGQRALIEYGENGAAVVTVIEPTRSIPRFLRPEDRGGPVPTARVPGGAAS